LIHATNEKAPEPAYWIKMDKPRILLIDDDAILRSGIRIYLEDSGFDVMEATNGHEGVATIRAEMPQLVLCDLRMPGMDGLKVLETLHDIRDELPFIVVTGQGVLKDAIAALQHGAWDFITKPIKDMRILDHAIERCLERARLIQENRAYREHLEDKVARRTLELKESEARLKGILSSFHRAFVLLFDESGEIIDVQGPPDMESRYGIQLSMILDLKLETILKPEHIELHMDAVRKVFSTGEASVTEVPVHLPNGVFWVEATHSAMHDGTGNIIAAVCFIQDVSQRHEAEEQKAQLEVQLRQAQKLEAIGTLAGGIAHDFNNILSAILGFTHLALQDTRDQPQINATLQEVYIAGQRAASLVKQILTFSRKAELQRGPLNIGPVVKEALKLLRASLPASIEIDARVESESGIILGDPTQIHQVVLNLGANAYHAMKSTGQGRLTVTLSSCTIDAQDAVISRGVAPGRYVRCTFKDTGEGMSSDVVEQVFDPFFTTKPVGEGTGMGLAIVHGIVTNSGGHILVDSKPGKGSTFALYFPEVENEAPATTDEERPIPTGTGSVLFVDDEEQLVMLGEVILERLGYQVTGCKDVLQALEFFRLDPNAFDCIVTDQTMPQMTGHSFINEILALRADIPIVLMTGLGQRIEDASAPGQPHQILDKPFDSYTLAEAVHSAMAKHPTQSNDTPGSSPEH